MQVTWEKPKNESKSFAAGANRIQFILAGIIILGAVIYLIVSGTAAGARYFLTVDEIVNNPDYVGQTVRISGAVIGDTIDYNSSQLALDFTIAHIPQEFEDLAQTLYSAVNNPNVTRLPVSMENEVMPDLLRHEAQAIVTGHLGEDGVFYASELLLKCPSRYEESIPGQTTESEG